MSYSKLGLVIHLSLGALFPLPVKASSKSVDNDAVKKSVELLKTAAKTRKVEALEIRKAFRVLEKAKIDPANFPSAIGGTKSPGRTWLLVFVSRGDDVIALSPLFDDLCSSFVEHCDHSIAVMQWDYPWNLLRLNIYYCFTELYKLQT
jgi:hypothetical protein